MSGSIRDLMTQAETASYDPSSIYRAGMRTLQSVMDGQIDNISPINPVVSVIEVQAALIAGFTESMRAETQRLLQVAAQDRMDLFAHMADIHFTNIFNLPSGTVMKLVLNKDEILNKMIPVPGTLSKKVTVPRNSYFTVGEYEFGIHYPIDIIQQVHGGLHVSYDTSKLTPLESLSTNTLKKRFAEHQGIEYLVIDVPVHQFNILSKTPTVTPATTFNYNVEISDLYYATRVYRTLTDGSQEELKLTYAEEVYDPQKPTALVKLLEGIVNIQIPQIYINNGQVQGELRIDVYTTKGPLETSFESYPIGSIGYRFRDLDKRAETTFSAPMQTLGTVTLLNEEPVTGGVLAMTFDELRTAVIADAIGDPTLPITPAQIQNFLSRKGYDIIKNTDIVTDRVFLASRDMPDPTNVALLTAANASIETMNAAFVDLVGNSAVIDNGLSITLTPNAVYRLDDGILHLMSDAELATIRAMRSDLLASHVTGNNYLYSPYHYVLDKANNQFRLSPYYLDDPQIDGQTFIADNESTLFQVNTAAKMLLKTADGFTLQVKTESSKEYQELPDASVQAMVGFRSPTEDDICWIMGEVVSVDTNGERTWEFKLGSRFAMNADDRLDFRNFKMYDMSDKTLYSDMLQDFTLIYSTTAQLGDLYQPSSIDALIPRFLAPANAAGITQEVLELHFGESLNNLWARARSVASSVVYETYPTDTLLRYTADQWKKDPDTGSEIFMVDGQPTRVLLHAKDDPVLTQDGHEIIQYPKGTIKTDAQGLPIPKSPRYLKHRFELFLIEGVYIFSNDQIAIDYRNSVAKTVAQWVTKDLVNIEKVTMDKSRAYFYPKTVFGTVEVMVSDGIVQQVSAGQRFDVVTYVPQDVMNNEDLKKQLKKQTIQVIYNYMKNRTLANSDIEKLLKEAYGEDAIDVQVSWFGELANIPVMQIVNEVHRCGIRKRLVSRDDEKLVVEEDITVTYQTIQ